ncbi:recombinase family protein [Nonomuraea muscovyensis]
MAVTDASVYDWNNPFGRRFLQTLAMVAEFEANLGHLRTREGMAWRRRTASSVGPRHPATGHLATGPRRAARGPRRHHHIRTGARASRAPAAPGGAAGPRSCRRSSQTESVVGTPARGRGGPARTRRRSRHCEARPGLDQCHMADR